MGRKHRGQQLLARLGPEACALLYRGDQEPLQRLLESKRREEQAMHDTWSEEDERDFYAFVALQQGDPGPLERPYEEACQHPRVQLHLLMQYLLTVERETGVNLSLYLPSLLGHLEALAFPER
jgi:hypothetical protein